MTFKKLKKGFTLIELMIVVAIIGILAALAIPNFIRFQARSKQSEAKANLKSLFTAERSYYQEHDTYSTCIKKIGFSPERGNRYHYVVNVADRVDDPCPTVELRDTAAGTVAQDNGAIAADVFKHGTGTGITNANGAIGFSAALNYTAVQPAGTTITVQNSLLGVVPNKADPNGSFGGGAQGDIDSDTDVDEWYVSSVSSTTGGSCPVLNGIDQNAPGGEPKNFYNDVNCP